MSELRSVPDLAQRQRALDAKTSFIVQAPAGSGKTELLTQRYLTLLARVGAPEEIIAITFTRKAAGEMRGRILAALQRAEHPEPPAQDHARQTWQLAREALARDQEQGWHLLQHPGRLRLQTIDSLCASLTRQMPLLSRFGAQPEVSEHPRRLYEEAAQRTVELLESGDAIWSPAVGQLLEHLDNDLGRVINMLAGMLARRDQWLRHLADHNDPRLQRESLECALTAVIEEALYIVAEALPADTREALVTRAAAAALHLERSGETSAISACLALQGLPEPGIEGLPVWLGLAELLLTRDGGWRRGLNKRQGFPAPSSTRDTEEKQRLSAHKEAMTELLARLAEEEPLRSALHRLRELPAPAYTDVQWELLEALYRLLPLSVAQLRLLFTERGEVDFTEVAQAALQALGEEERPTDLALALDYRISHILVDEFQDTSLSQYQLLSRLTAGWQPGDGRTLFAVGDPMQSIYRFRDAQVGLYLQARRYGIGELELEPLHLEANFRSRQGIVDWVNGCFREVLPGEERIVSGAVPYAESAAMHPAEEGEAVTVHPFYGRDDEAEAARVVQLIEQAREKRPDADIAVLVRSRSHLAAIVPALKAAGQRFRAVEIEHLGHRPVVRDLLALTRALLHPADRTAWLAILRAPWCGLSLDDLHALVADCPEQAVWSLLADTQRWERLGEEGRQRLERILPVLEQAHAARRHRNLRERVEACWQSLGGPACVANRTQLEDAAVYFALLEGGERGADLDAFSELEQAVAELYALPDVEADGSLQLMTIHKSKGLEFDTVILPGLGRRPPNDDNPLLMWTELPAVEERGSLLLAPVHATGADASPIYDYLKKLDKEKGRYEDGRLLYVAATRARRRLHLLGHSAIQDKDGEVMLREPAAGSLLAQLWPVLEAEYRRRLPADLPLAGSGDRAAADNTLYRLRADWRLPPPPHAFLPRQPQQRERLKPQRRWVGDTLRHVGTVVHRLLQLIAEEGASAWDAGRLKDCLHFIDYRLLELGVPGSELLQARDRTVEAVLGALDDERGRWLLQEHEEAACEHPLSGLVDGRWLTGVIDRTFVDEHGQRWIIDYKSSFDPELPVEAFLDAEQERYRTQLERYAALMAQDETRPIRLGLYFPLFPAWKAWSYP